jgi:8-oxo-dGTP pyrophosphatase MutT (NUDIX family)
MNVAVVVARFQGPNLTAGHRSLLDRVRHHADRVVIVLGIAPVVCLRDPLTYSLREQMVRALYPDAVIWGLPNHRYDRDWAAALDRFLYTAFPRAKCRLYGCRDSCLESYRKYGYNEVQYLDTLDLHANISASSERDKLKERDTEDFRAGVIYGVQSACPRVLPAVDIAIYREHWDGRLDPGKQLLLVRKQSEQEWRFPGGCLDSTDLTLEHAARREAYEETGLGVDTLTYLSSRRIDDWRYQRTNISVFSTLFVTPWIGGAPKPKDKEIADVQWLPLNDTVLALPLVTEHLPFYQDFLTWIAKEAKNAQQHHDADRLLQAESL